MIFKKEELNKCLTEYLQKGLILALSGGVDSALLLAVVARFPIEQRQRFLAITFETILYPEDEIKTAKSLCQSYLIEHCLVKPEDEIPVAIKHNPKDRCYRCKKNLFQQVLILAQNRGYSYIMDGTNADDLKSYRPGRQALMELGIKSPLADCGFTKTEIRTYAAELGLALADKPSGSCYATRLPYGAELNKDLISKIAELEEFLRGFGLSQVRVRYHQPIVRIELMPAEFPLFLKRREQALQKAEELGFAYLTLDMAGFRSGSMDIDLLAPYLYL